MRYEGAGTREKGFLLRALVDAWDNRCYMCNASGDHTEFEIDHLVPLAKAAEGIKQYGLPAGFDVQAPENLAPICSAGPRCNQKKSDKLFDLPRHGWISIALESAATKAPAVERSVQQLRTSRGLAKAIDHVLGADLDSKAKDLIQKSGRGLVERIKAVDATLVEDAPTQYRHWPAADIYMGELPGCTPDGYGDVVLELDNEGRRARAVLELACGIDLSDFLDDLLRSLIQAQDERVSDEHPGGDYWDHFSVQGWRDISGTELRARRVVDEIQVDISGRYLSSHYAGQYGMDNDGKISGHHVGSVEILLDGDYRASTSIPLTSPWEQFFEIDSDAVELTEYDDRAPNNYY